MKLLEFALNRDIASSKAVPRNTTIVVVAGVAVALAAILVYLAVAISADPS